MYNSVVSFALMEPYYFTLTKNSSHSSPVFSAFCFLLLSWMNVFINKKKCYSRRGLVKQPLFRALAGKQWESTDGSESMREKLWKKQDSCEGKKRSARNSQPHDGKKSIKDTCVPLKLAMWIKAKDSIKKYTQTGKFPIVFNTMLLWHQSIVPNFLKAVKKGLHICQH